MAESRAAERSAMRSVERTLDVIDILADSGGPLKLAEVARKSGLHIATAQRILRVLERRNYVAQSSAGYTVGAAALVSAQSFVVRNQLVLVATPVLQELAKALGLTASLSVRVGSARVLVARVEGTSPPRYQLPIGGRLPLHLGAGKVFLADLEPQARAAVLDGLGDEFVTAGGEKITPAELTARLDEIADRGYAVSHSERVLGTVSVAAPVRSRDGSLLCVVQVTGRDDEITDDALADAKREILNACASIAARFP